MKKCLNLLLFCGLTMTSAQAAWEPSDSRLNVIGKNNEYGQCVLHSLVTPTGHTVVTWLKTPEDMRYDDPAFGFYLYMQIFDGEGNAVFPQEGHLVSGNATLSWVADYGMACMENGDVVIAYADNRYNEPYVAHVYAYRYTMEGQPVWDEKGVAVPAMKKSDAAGNELAVELCVSGDNIYVAYVHEEGDLWEYQINRLNAEDGSMAWSQPVKRSTDQLKLYEAPEGMAYVLFATPSSALSAQKLNAQGEEEWPEEVAVFEEPLSYYGGFNDLCVAKDVNGCLAITSTIMNYWTYYIGVNYLEPDGGTYLKRLVGNGDPDLGDSAMPVIACRDGLTCVAWNYKIEQDMMWVNLFDNEKSDYAWTGDQTYGLMIDANDMWGMNPVSVIAQNDGWVIIYGNCKSWNGADYKVAKIDDEGNLLWSRSLACHDLKTNDMSVASDGRKAILFFTCDSGSNSEAEIDGEAGGMYMMCVDIAQDDTPTAIQLQGDDATVSRYYDLNGHALNGSLLSGLVVEQQDGHSQLRYIAGE